MNHTGYSMEYDKKVMPNAGGDNERVRIWKKRVHHTEEIIGAWRDSKEF